MSAQNSFAIFNAPSDFHLDLVARLVGVNLDCLEKMVSTQISPLKELLECGGKREVDEVIRWSEPGPDAAGKIRSEVIFMMTLKDAPQELQELFDLYNDRAKAEGVKPYRKVTLEKTSDGWRPAGRIEWAQEKIAQ